MKAIITVIGKDAVGILAKVSDTCANSNVNIVEVTQSVLHDM
ncbi:MAG: ACT domain-containing protein, partial [Ruminococcus sp.]|nr:ACT domain-containing protein [Ruminococcus sp.]